MTTRTGWKVKGNGPGGWVSAHFDTLGAVRDESNDPPDRFEQLEEWPEYRPLGIVFQHDHRTRTVYVCSCLSGKRLLAIPFERFLEEAEYLR